MIPAKNQFRKIGCSGFTMIELVLVFVLLGIISVSVIPFWNDAEVNLTHQSDLFVRNLRHAQTLAIHRATQLTVDISSDSYSVKDGESIINDPATGDSFLVTLEDGVSFSLYDDFVWDSLGRPTDGDSLISSNIEQTMTGGARSRNITIAPVTGAVSVVEE